MARTHVVLSDRLLAAIDALVGRRRRSRFLEEAAAEKLARAELAAALRATAGIARGPEYRHWRDRKTAAAWVRRTRRTERAG
jgi:hypothetical protein